MNGERVRRTKVVCTIGPASSDPSRLRTLAEAGADVVRLNMSHCAAAEAERIARDVRECAAALGRPMAVMVDLQGPKIRIGRLAGPVDLAPGQRLTLAPADAAAGDELPITYPGLATDLREGDRVLLADGRIELRVRRLRPPRVDAEVVVGGSIASGKGVNLPGVHVSAPALTEKDRADLALALAIEADYVALSFARSAEHVRELRRLIPADVLIVTKIEKDAALEDLDAIIDESDAVIVARGDLGSELPFEKVPLAQKRIVRSANTRYCPVVIATEILESMVERSRPTRAEVSDAANAVLDGADALMLSAETAVGRFPLDSLQALTRVIREVEAAADLLAGGPIYDVPEAAARKGPATTEVATAAAAIEAVRATRAPAIVSFTKSGHTARVVSSRRPPVPILTVTDSVRVYQQLALVWGVVPVVHAGEPSSEAMWETARAELVRRGLASRGDRVVVTAGWPFHVRGTTNMMRIETL